MELLEAIAGGVLAALLIGWIGTRPYGFGGASRKDPELLGREPVPLATGDLHIA
jgi:hypothetical protein